MKITGTIKHIEYRNTQGHEKKVVTLAPDGRQRAFIEFRGRRMQDLDAFTEEDDIEVTVTMEGKTSKSSGIQYNNLVAQQVAKA